jgi:hypothetical protein
MLDSLGIDQRSDFDALPEGRAFALVRVVFKRSMRSKGSDVVCRFANDGSRVVAFEKEHFVWLLIGEIVPAGLLARELEFKKGDSPFVIVIVVDLKRFSNVVWAVDQ